MYIRYYIRIYIYVHTEVSIYTWAPNIYIYTKICIYIYVILRVYLNFILRDRREREMSVSLALEVATAQPWKPSSPRPGSGDVKLPPEEFWFYVALWVSPCNYGLFWKTSTSKTRFLKAPTKGPSRSTRPGLRAWVLKRCPETRGKYSGLYGPSVFDNGFSEIGCTVYGLWECKGPGFRSLWQLRVGLVVFCLQGLFDSLYYSIWPSAPYLVQ